MDPTFRKKQSIWVPPPKEEDRPILHIPDIISLNLS
jgi:hypothetical protein